MKFKEFINEDEKKVEPYHCPNCNAVDTLWPKHFGSKKTYVCSECGEMYGSAKLDKIWGREKQKSFTITPMPEKK